MGGKCIIVGAGDLTVSEVKKEEQDLVIAADGGFSYCAFLELVPDIIVGDYDSLGEEELQNLKRIMEDAAQGNSGTEVVVLPVEKDDTDMLAAIKIGLEKGYRDFRIYAGMGGRFDHSIANVQCLLYLKKHGASGYLCDGTGMILVLQDESVEFKEDLEGVLSLFALGKEASGVTIRGMKYTMEKGTITNDYPVGISNEFIGQKAYIAVEKGELLCVLQWVG